MLRRKNYSFLMNTKGKCRLRMWHVLPARVFHRQDADATKLFLAKNDARLGQIVGRELDFDLIAGNDANEMLAHFSGDVGEHVALPGKIDPKHRARQHLRDDSFRDDLFFFRHRVKYTPTGASLNSVATALRAVSVAQRRGYIECRSLSHVL
jgi:hypothetical protein